MSFCTSTRLYWLNISTSVCRAELGKTPFKLLWRYKAPVENHEICYLHLSEDGLRENSKFHWLILRSHFLNVNSRFWKEEEKDFSEPCEMIWTKSSAWRKGTIAAYRLEYLGWNTSIVTRHPLLVIRYMLEFIRCGDWQSLSSTLIDSYIVSMLRR